MRYSPTHKQKSRQTILEAGSRLFRERGYNGVGVDAVMAGAGLTPGGFYSHFASKEDLFAEAIARTRSTLGADVPDMDLDYLIRAYLSRSHRDGAAEGCLFAALTPDVARAGEPVRERYTERLGVFLEMIESRLPDEAPGVPPAGSPERRTLALAVMSQLIGGLMLSRAVADRDLSDAILKACRQQAAQTAGLTPRPAGRTEGEGA